jgi:hypothetical protein
MLAGEVDDMWGLKSALEAENRVLAMLTPEDMKSRFGFSAPNALLLSEKVHDKTINPNFMRVLADYLRQQKGNEVVDGVLRNVYTDDPTQGGYAEIAPNDGSGTRFVPFSRLVMSLGAQRITDSNSKPLLDVVAARGVSSIALVYMPQSRSLPNATVCGATNHVTHLAGPVPTVRNGETVNCYLVKLTCSACITPNVLDRSCADYDSVAAVGLLSAARQTLGCEVEPITLWGCNRQVSRWGQSHWLEVKSNGETVALSDCGTHRPLASSGIHVQLGAGGGGLTVGPSQPPV